MKAKTIDLKHQSYEMRITKNFVTCYWKGRYIATHFTEKEAIEFLEKFDKERNYLL